MAGSMKSDCSLRLGRVGRDGEPGEAGSVVVLVHQDSEVGDAAIVCLEFGIDLGGRERDLRELAQAVCLFSGQNPLIHAPLSLVFQYLAVVDKSLKPLPLNLDLF